MLTPHWLKCYAIWNKNNQCCFAARFCHSILHINQKCVMNVEWAHESFTGSSWQLLWMFMNSPIKLGVKVPPIFLGLFVHGVLMLNPFLYLLRYYPRFNIFGASLKCGWARRSKEISSKATTGFFSTRLPQIVVFVYCCLAEAEDFFFPVWDAIQLWSSPYRPLLSYFVSTLSSLD